MTNRDNPMTNRDNQRLNKTQEDEGDGMMSSYDFRKGFRRRKLENYGKRKMTGIEGRHSDNSRKRETIPEENSYGSLRCRTTETHPLRTRRETGRNSNRSGSDCSENRTCRSYRTNPSEKAIRSRENGGSETDPIGNGSREDGTTGGGHRGTGYRGNENYA